MACSSNSSLSYKSVKNNDTKGNLQFLAAASHVWIETAVPDLRMVQYNVTSNFQASTVIADHAMQLRRDADDILRQREIDLDRDAAAPSKDVTTTTEEKQVTISRRFKEKVVQPILKRHFGRDEFLGRINEIVYFLPFSRVSFRLTQVMRQYGA